MSVHALVDVDLGRVAAPAHDRLQRRVRAKLAPVQTDAVRQDLYAPIYQMHAEYEEVHALEHARRLLEFTWVTLPEGVSAMELFDVAAKLNVAFVPGLPFYVDGGGTNTLRLNFSNSSEAKIETGITRLAEALQQMMQ